MPKMKTNRGAAKRFGRTASGGLKRAQSHRRHILTKKSTKRKRHLRSGEMVHACRCTYVESFVSVRISRSCNCNFRREERWHE